MPSLFRFLVAFAILCGAVYAAVYSLAHFVPVQPRDITVTITPDKFLKR